ncbi:hypothetical protein F4808DRAFT_448285 [Astrocystis sublimbata]|nr:hypothetical protein F4808DRAFT_448285 [Astrocystis sublimbata]
MANIDDDHGKSLGDIASRYGKPIVSLLVDIQDTQQPRKFWPFIKNLECFYLGLEDHSRSPDELRPKAYKQRTPISRRRINAFKNKDFVVISYPWSPSDKREDRKDKYRVQNRNGQMFYPSTVRDCVWDRVFNYMHNRAVKLLWIDRQSIRQREYKRKNAANHPTGLLEGSICSSEDLSLLATFLKGTLTKGNKKTRNFRLADAISLQQAWNVFRVLDAITMDKWKKMNLLLRHTPGLETKKRELGLFGSFSHQATLLCLALRSYDVLKTGKVLGAIGEYRLLLDSSHSMTAQVIKDVEKKAIQNFPDRLPIIANCCQYPIRVDVLGHHRRATSLSLSILAMCLLNGEILQNDSNDMAKRHAWDMTVSDYLQVQRSSLTFKKGCHFSNVCLERSGPPIDTATFPGIPPRRKDHSDPLTPYQQDRLAQLASILKSTSYKDLADKLEAYLQQSPRRAVNNRSGRIISPRYLCFMAQEVVRAIDNKKMLRLASLCTSKSIGPYTAIFIWENDGVGDAIVPGYPEQLARRESANFAFTAFNGREKGASGIDCKVSL